MRSKISKEGEFVVTAAIDDGDYVESDGESDRDISSDEEPEEDADEDEEDPNSTSKRTQIPHPQRTQIPHPHLKRKRLRAET